MALLLHHVRDRLITGSVCHSGGFIGCPVLIAGVFTSLDIFFIRGTRSLKFLSVQGFQRKIQMFAEDVTEAQALLIADMVKPDSP